MPQTRSHPDQQSPMQNHLINGGFRIWQRGVSFSAGSGQFTADKWDSSNDAAVEQVTDSKYGQYALALEDTGTGGFGFVSQRIENPSDLDGQTLTLSGWAKEGSTSPTNAGIRIRFFDGSDALIDQWTTAFTPSASYEKVSVESGMEVPDNIGRIEIVLFGANPSDSSDTGETIFDGVTLTVGEFPIDYPEVIRPIGLEQSLAERYYEVHQTQRLNAKPLFGDPPATTLDLRYRTEKSSVPSLTASVTDVNTATHSAIVNSDDTANWSLGFGLESSKNSIRLNLRRDSSASIEVAEFDYSVEAEVT